MRMNRGVGRGVSGVDLRNGMNGSKLLLISGVCQGLEPWVGFLRHVPRVTVEVLGRKNVLLSSERNRSCWSFHLWGDNWGVNLEFVVANWLWLGHGLVAGIAF